MEAEQTAWLLSNGVPTTNSDAKYTWHVAPEAKVCMFLYLKTVCKQCIYLYMYFTVYHSKDNKQILYYYYSNNNNICKHM